MFTLLKYSILVPFKILYYAFYPFVWLYKRYFGYPTASTDGIQFEYTCADILRNRGFINVEVTKASGDQGIDVLAYKGGKSYAIQCKLYSDPVGNSAVQEAFAGMEYYGCTNAAVMTNSTFTQSAEELADRIGVELWGNTPTSSKRARNPWVFWISLAATLVYCFVLDVTLDAPDSIISDKQGNAILVWIGFIVLYIIAYPLINGAIEYLKNLSKTLLFKGTEENNDRDLGEAGIDVSVEYEYEDVSSTDNNEEVN